MQGKTRWVGYGDDDCSLRTEQCRLLQVLQGKFHERQGLERHVQLGMNKRRLAAALQGRQEIEAKFRLLRSQVGRARLATEAGDGQETHVERGDGTVGLHLDVARQNQGKRLASMGEIDVLCSV